MQPQRTIGVPKEERELVTSLAAALKRADPRSKKNLICTEVDCFQGVADIVVGKVNGYRLFPRNTSTRKLELITLSTAKVLSALSGRNAGEVHTVAQRCALTSSTVQRQFRILCNLGLARFEPGGRIRLLRTIKKPFQDISAFEVKVKDWKSGLCQARNYRSFANRVSLALPTNRANRLRSKLAVFRQFGVGLVGINGDSELTWFLRPRRCKPISAARNMLASTLLIKRARRNAA